MGDWTTGIGPEGSSSQTIAKVAPALVAALADMPSPKKDSVNPHFNSRYASLDSILSTARPVLAKHGLGLFFCGGGAVTERAMLSGCSAVVVHTSGEWVRSTVSMPISPNATPPQYGSLMTYARKYAAFSVLGMAPDEDDDANAASGPPQGRQAPPQQRGAQAHAADPKAAGAKAGGYDRITDKMAGDLFAIARKTGDRLGVHGFRVIDHCLAEFAMPTLPRKARAPEAREHVREHVTPDYYQSFRTAVERWAPPDAPDPPGGHGSAGPDDEPPPHDDGEIPF